MAISSVFSASLSMLNLSSPCFHRLATTGLNTTLTCRVKIQDAFFVLELYHTWKVYCPHLTKLQPPTSVMKDISCLVIDLFYLLR